MLRDDNLKKINGSIYPAARIRQWVCWCVSYVRVWWCHHGPCELRFNLPGYAMTLCHEVTHHDHLKFLYGPSASCCICSSVEL